MKAARLLCGLILAVVVPLIAYILTMLLYMVFCLQFFLKFPTLVGILTCYLASAGVFVVMQKARAQALGLTRKEAFAQSCLFLFFLAPGLVMLSMRWRS